MKIKKSSEKELIKEFDITLLDLKDILQDLLDDEFEIDISLNYKDSFQVGYFKYKFFIISIYSQTGKLFKTKLVTKSVNEINNQLRNFGLSIFFVSNMEDELSIAINLFVVDDIERKELAKQYPDIYEIV